MWRTYPLIGALFFLLWSTPATAQVSSDDFQCAPCGERCEQLGLDADDTVCSGPRAPVDTYDRRYGLRFNLHGLGTPSIIVDGELSDLPRLRSTRTGVYLGPRRQHPTIRLYGSGPAAEVGEAYDTEDGRVLRIHNDEPSLAQTETGDDEETVIRIHNDPPEDGADVEPGPQPETENGEPEETGPAEIPDFVTGYVDWEFIPAFRVLETSGPVSDVDAQRTIQADEEAISECFETSSYPGGGTVDVQAHLAYNGAVTAVNGTTDGIRPNQARCILQRAWRYDFPRLADGADESSEVSYRVEFIGRQVDPPETDADRPQLLLERVRLNGDASEELEQRAADSLTDQLGDVEQCAADGLRQLSTDMVANEVRARWRHVEGGRYSLRAVDITVTNKTSSELPSGDVVDCWKNALSRWDLDLESDDDAELPDELVGSFYVTVRPAGWYGM